MVLVIPIYMPLAFHIPIFFTDLQLRLDLSLLDLLMSALLFRFGAFTSWRITLLDPPLRFSPVADLMPSNLGGSPSSTIAETLDFFVMVVFLAHFTEVVCHCLPQDFCPWGSSPFTRASIGRIRLLHASDVYVVRPPRLGREVGLTGDILPHTHSYYMSIMWNSIKTFF